MRAPRNGPLSPIHAPDSTTTLGSLDPAAEAEWDAAWPPVTPLGPAPQGGAPGMAEMPPMLDLPNMPPVAPPAGPSLQTPRLQSPPPGAPHSPFRPDGGTGLGNNMPLDPNLPPWLFERPDQWESPPAVSGMGANPPGRRGGSPAGPAPAQPAGWGVPSAFDQPPQQAGYQPMRAPTPTPRGIYAPDPAAVASFFDEPAAPQPAPVAPPPWQTLRDALPADVSPTGEAWPDAPPVADEQTRGRFGRFRLPGRLASLAPKRTLRHAPGHALGHAPGQAPDRGGGRAMAQPQMPQMAHMAQAPQMAQMPPSMRGAARPPAPPRVRPLVRSIRLPWAKGRGRTPTLTESLTRGTHVAQDTGRGWRVVMPVVDPNAAAGNAAWMAPAPPRKQQPLAVIGGLTRLTFNLLLLAIIAAILAIPVSIGMTRLLNAPQARTIVHPTPTVPPVPTPYAGFKTFTGQSQGFTLAYPENWHIQAAGLSTQASGDMQGNLFAPSVGSNVGFALLSRSSVSSANLDNILDTGYLKLTSGQESLYNPISPPGPGPTLASVKWRSVTYTFLLNGVPMQAQALAANHGTWTYVIVWQAPQSQFGTLAAQDFTPMLNSVRLVG